MESDELVEIHVSSAPFAKNGQIDALIETFGRKFFRVEVDLLDDQPLQVDCMVRSLPGFALISGSLSPTLNRHTAELVDSDDLVLAVIQSGVAEVSQYGRTAIVKDGHATLKTAGAPSIFTTRSPVRVVKYRFSRNLLRPNVANLDDLVARPIAKDNPVLQLLLGYASVLDNQDALATAELRHAVSTHMHDLGALLFGGKPEQHLAGGFRAARLQAVKEDILQRMTQGDLSVGEIARSQQISERYLRKLFAASGTSFTDFVREARLARALRMLTDPSQFHQPVNTIAYESGFGDLSYFNRAFRQRYDMTPSQARELARQKSRDGS